MRLTINNIPDGFRYADLVTEELGLSLMSGPIEVGDEYSIGSYDGWEQSGYSAETRPNFVVIDPDSESERPPLVLWQVNAEIELKRELDDEVWTSKRIVPVFYLDAALSGVYTDIAAERLAREILLKSTVNPGFDPEVTATISVSVVSITYKLADDQR